MPRKCILATPTHDGSVDALYAYALAETIRHGIANDVAFLPLLIPGDALIQSARNDLFALAYKSDADDVIWIDADMGWDPTWPLRLLNYPVDVVGGTARRKTDIETYVCKCPPDKLDDIDANGLIKVEGLGLAFTRMSHKAMKALWDIAEVYAAPNTGEERRWIFDVTITDGKLMSEDIGMCRRLGEMGISLYLDPMMTCDHVGRHVFSGDFSKWMYEFLAARAQELAPKVERLPTLH